MPIITKPATIDKNSPAEISLDKSALAAVPSVVADDYFSDSDNWKEVFLYYKSSTGNQREILKFNAELASPTANFLVSDKALDIFEVQKIVIVDFDSGNITIPRSQLTTADFDVDMSEQAGAAIVWDTFISGFTLGADGAISKAGAVSDYGYCPRSSVGLSGDFELTFEALDTDLLNGWCVGASTSISDNPENGLNQCIFYYDLGNLYIYKQGGFITGPLSLASGNNVFKMVRTSGVMSFFLNGSPVSVSSSSFSGTVYPEARVGGAVKKATVISAIPSVTWDFVSRPAYSLNAQSEITSSLTVLSYDTSTILFSLSEYTIPANGLELKMVANNGWAIEDAHFFGVCDPSETVFNGFYYDANTGIPSFGVNNILQFPYTHPATPEVEFKIIIKTTQTEFYVNGILQPTQPPLAPVSNGSPTIKVATRFDNDINIKSCTIVEL